MYLQEEGVYVVQGHMKLTYTSSMGKYSNTCTNFPCCIDKDGDNATMGACQQSLN